MHITSLLPRLIYHSLNLYIIDCLAAGCLVGVGYVGCDYNIAVALLCISGALIGIAGVTTCVNHLDIAPKYAGKM